MHAVTPSSSSLGIGASGCSVSSAIRAASCSACFFERPAPRPTGAPPTVATTSNVRSCGGPSSATIVYSTVSARRARRSCSVDLKSTGLLSAFVISGWKASTTAAAVRS